MLVTNDMVFEYWQEHRVYPGRSFINPNEDGVYIFHNMELYLELIHTADNYLTNRNGIHTLIPGIKKIYELKDAKQYLEKMLGD